jgi:16S rRNA (adenine1518-N6/adenine1519-N6)-dimethyltransferase
VRHIPRKRFGQHFLTDASVIDGIVQAIAPKPADRLVEIGPGLGALTVPLLARVAHLDVVELDRDLAARLREQYPESQVSVHQADALAFDFQSLPGPLRVVGNLPYNISTPLLFHMSESAQHCTDLHFMLQEEVVDRMVAAPGSKVYGRLSVMLQYRFRMEKLFEVPPSAFDPPPKVSSAVVRLRPRGPEEANSEEAMELGRVVTAAFSTRRKTLRNALSGVISAEELNKLGIDSGLRAEALSLSAFLAIAKRVKQSA